MIYVNHHDCVTPKKITTQKLLMIYSSKLTYACKHLQMGISAERHVYAPVPVVVHTVNSGTLEPKGRCCHWRSCTKHKLDTVHC